MLPANWGTSWFLTPLLCLLLQDILLPEELDKLLQSAHRPNYVLQVLSELIANSSIISPERFRMDQNLTFFADALGACERILKTPIPLSYTRCPAPTAAFKQYLTGFAETLLLHLSNSYRVRFVQPCLFLCGMSDAQPGAQPVACWHAASLQCKHCLASLQSAMIHSSEVQGYFWIQPLDASFLLAI